jgi:hypothetical protein
MEAKNISKIYQSIGEFVVTFQGIENRIRELGWLILDPERKTWPPTKLRNELNSDLIEEVIKLYCEFIDTINIDQKEDRKKDFKSLMDEFHEMRAYRNKLLHSAYLELKAGGEVVDLLRSNPKLKHDNITGEPIYDIEILTEQNISKNITKYADAVFNLNLHYTQIIHAKPL